MISLQSLGRQYYSDLQHPRLFSVHFGLPCGTASRARERPVSEELRAQGVPSPLQLRSADYLLGLPGLSILNQQKADSANALYALAIEVLVQIIPRDIVVSIENPWNSWMWSALVALAVKHSELACNLYNQLQFVQFHACCHGSSRRKSTGWLSTAGVFADLQAQCRHDHFHAPWGVSWKDGRWVFDTSSEASYPKLLAQRATACLIRVAQKRGFSLQGQLRLHDKSTASIGQQTKKHKALIPEYHHIKVQPIQDPIPSGAKIIAPHSAGEVREEREQSDDDMHGKEEIQTKPETQKVGFFHTPGQFLSLARKVSHPMDSVDHLEAVTKGAIQFNLDSQPS